jgi:hypothetical protein
MAETPTDPRWPASDEVDFDSVLNRLLTLKRLHFREHTARDLSDPLIQILRLIAALGQHSLQRANHALKQLNPKTATSRRALIALMEVVNRPLRPMVPARGKVYAKLAVTPTVDTAMIEKGARIIQPGITDPIYTVDADVSTGASVAFSAWFWDSSADTTSVVTFGVAQAFDVGDAWIIGFDGLQFDAITVTLAVPHGAAQVYCLEYYNEEWGSPNSVTDLVTNLRFSLMDYLHADTVDVDTIAGLSVTVKYKPTNTTETVDVLVYSGTTIVAVTSLLGQTSPSTSASDYEVVASWRPVPSPTDGTSGFTASGTISFTIADLRSDTDWWEENSSYGYALRLRSASGVGLPDSITITSVAIATSGSYYATANITQGYLATYTLGQTDGTLFQLIPLTSSPIQEPVEDPAIVIEVGTDTDWSIVDDLSNSGSSSKHAILREDVDDGWCLGFGDGTIGVLPNSGSAVRVTHRSGSIQPGDLDSGTSVKAVSSSGTVRNWVLPRALTGYAAPECSNVEDVMRYRASIIPQLSLRAESVVTPDEITTALSGGAPNRATFETSDGRSPFSRALWTVEGAGERQYRVIVVGDVDDDDGAAASADLTEAEEWLNGVAVGVQIIGGHGPQNTEAIVGAFTSRVLKPTIGITIGSATGVREQADQVVRLLLKPHAVDDDGAWRWDFGGSVPVAVLFGKLWDGIPNRTLITLTVSDGVTTYGIGDSIDLQSTELPVLDPTYDSAVDITVTVA